MKLIIPSANRSKKLKRTLSYYSELKNSGINLEICLLDGSDYAERSEYIALAEEFSLSHFKWYNLGLNERLLKASETLLSDKEVFFIGNDEDVFTASYIEKAYNFMQSNVEYSTYIGKYFTLARPIMGFHRTPFERLSVDTFDLNSNNYCARMDLLSRLLLAGISPLFYGARRGEQFAKSCKVFNDLRLGSTGELADQILLAYYGKIFCSKEIMLLRDETKISFEQRKNHARLDVYISCDDVLDLSEALSRYTDIRTDLVGSFSANYGSINTEGLSVSNAIFYQKYKPFKTFQFLNLLYRSFLTIFEIINFYLLANQIHSEGMPKKVFKKVIRKIGFK